MTLPTRVLLTAARVQIVSLSYGTCAGLRGFFFSLLNTELIQKLR